MGEYYREFYQKFRKIKYPSNSIEKALAVHFAHPKITERLVNLSLSENDLYSVFENPWYEETKNSEISYDDLIILKDYFKFKKKEQEKMKQKYKKELKNTCCISPNYKKPMLPHFKYSERRI